MCVCVRVVFFGGLIRAILHVSMSLMRVNTSPLCAKRSLLCMHGALLCLNRACFCAFFFHVQTGLFYSRMSHSCG